MLAGARGTTYQVGVGRPGDGEAAAGDRAAERAGGGRGPDPDPPARRSPPLPRGATRPGADLRPHGRDAALRDRPLGGARSQGHRSGEALPHVAAAAGGAGHSPRRSGQGRGGRRGGSKRGHERARSRNHRPEAGRARTLRGHGPQRPPARALGRSSGSGPSPQTQRRRRPCRPASSAANRLRGLPISSTCRTLATSPASVLGAASNQPSRISSSTASLVVRRDSARTLASFHLRAPRAVSASAQRAARTPATLLAAIDAPVPVQQQTIPCSARPSATSRAAASLPRPSRRAPRR